MLARPLRLLLTTAVAASVAALLAGCTAAVALDPAPDANNPRCADVTVHLPDAVAGQAQRETNAQATGAWGDPALVLLRCGVKPIAATTRPCVTVNGIDWVLENSPEAKVGRYITFGRIPATEVVIDRGTKRVNDAGVLPDFADAIGEIPQQKKQRCLAISDVPESGGSATATPTPTPTPSATSR